MNRKTCKEIFIIAHYASYIKVVFENKKGIYSYLILLLNKKEGQGKLLSLPLGKQEVLLILG